MIVLLIRPRLQLFLWLSTLFIQGQHFRVKSNHCWYLDDNERLCTIWSTNQGHIKQFPYINCCILPFINQLLKLAHMNYWTKVTFNISYKMLQCNFMVDVREMSILRSCSVNTFEWWILMQFWWLIKEFHLFGSWPRPCHVYALMLNNEYKNQH